MQETLRSAPLLSSTVAVSWQGLGSNAHAYRFESIIDIKTIFRLKVDHTSFSYNQTQEKKISNMTSFFGALHLPIKKLTLIQGIGWTSYKYGDRHSGPATLFQIEYETTPLIKFGIGTESAYIQKRFDHKIRIVVMYGIQSFNVRLGYHWMKLNSEKINMPEIGLVVRF